MSLVDRVDAWFWPPTDLRRTYVSRFRCGLSPRASARVLLAWRLLSFAWEIAIQIYVWNLSGDKGYYLAFLTIDSNWLNLLYFLVSSCLMIAALVRPAEALDAPARGGCSRWAELHGHRLANVLLAFAVSWETIVVLLFWCVPRAPGAQCFSAGAGALPAADRRAL
jgi:hypothetical protein